RRDDNFVRKRLWHGSFSRASAVLKYFCRIWPWTIWLNAGCRNTCGDSDRYENYYNGASVTFPRSLFDRSHCEWVTEQCDNGFSYRVSFHAPIIFADTIGCLPGPGSFNRWGRV